jgi:predicted HicB family RNase H-like nuclease
MTIARIPRRSATDIQTEDAFITGAAPAARDVGKTRNKTSIMLRIDPELLADITREAKQAGLTRSAWIHSTLTRAARIKD